jgi:hypothetical protein
VQKESAAIKRKREIGMNWLPKTRDYETPSRPRLRLGPLEQARGHHVLKVLLNHVLHLSSCPLAPVPVRGFKLAPAVERLRKTSSPHVLPLL